jgi:hypothetical protein
MEKVEQHGPRACNYFTVRLKELPKWLWFLDWHPSSTEKFVVMSTPEFRCAIFAGWKAKDFAGLLANTPELTFLNPPLTIVSNV